LKAVFVRIDCTHSLPTIYFHIFDSILGSAVKIHSLF